MNFNENMIFTLAAKSDKVFLPVYISCTLGEMQQITESQLSEKPSILQSIVYCIMSFSLLPTILELSSWSDNISKI